MLFRQHGVAGVKEALAQYRKNIPAVEPYLVDKIRLASENREVLVAVYRVNRFDSNPFDVERLSGVRHNDAILWDFEFLGRLQTWARQHKNGALLAGNRANRRG